MKWCLPNFSTEKQLKQKEYFHNDFGERRRNIDFLSLLLLVSSRQLCADIKILARNVLLSFLPWM